MIMQNQRTTRLAAAAGAAAAASAPLRPADAAKVDSAALDRAFEALKTYDWGADPTALKALDDAVVASLGDPTARKDLEARLASVLDANVSRDAKNVVCRALRIMGTAESVPTLRRLLSDEELSHMARYALERIQAPEAGAALREALPRVSGTLQAGVAGSLGARRDVAAVPALSRLLRGDDAAIVVAAATALGAIATVDAAKALAAAAKTAPASARAAVTDGALRAAEQLAATGKKAEAKDIYKVFLGDDQPDHVKRAAARGMSGGR